MERIKSLKKKTGSSMFWHLANRNCGSRRKSHLIGLSTFLPNIPEEELPYYYHFPVHNFIKTLYNLLKYEPSVAEFTFGQYEIH
jgi:hypothetical protein